MRAVICTKPFEMKVEISPTPVPGAGEVLVQVGASGICAGDQYIYTGKNPYCIYPVIAGHEISGTIERLGEGVASWQKGQRVVIEPFIGCGKCYPCGAGKPNCCADLSILGVHQPGGYAEFVVAPAKNLFLVPPDMPLWKASMAEPITIAIHACNRGAVTEKDSVLVMGCGPIGLNVIEIARERGAKVYACDINTQRLEAARLLGADPLLSDEKLEDTVMEITEGEGMPVIIEAAGVAQVMEQAVRMIAPGGRVVILGLVKRGVNLSLPGLDFTRKELTILGSRTEVGDFPEAIRLLNSGKLKFAGMTTQLNMQQAPETFAELATKPDKYFKGILINDL